MKFTSSRCRCEYCTDLPAKHRLAKKSNHSYDGRIKTVKTYIRKVKLLFNQTQEKWTT
jgi:hypothetical protein